MTLTTNETKFIAFVAMLVLCVILGIKNEVTYRRRRKIVMAIERYHHDCFIFNEKELVEYGDLRSYSASLFRIWNWGYTSVMKKEKFEIIKSYIPKKR